MKWIACLLSVVIPFSVPVAQRSEVCPVHSDGAAMRWYVKRNHEHKTPELPPEFSCLAEYDGYYADTNLKENAQSKPSHLISS